MYVHISHSFIYSFVPSCTIFVVYSYGFKILVSLKKKLLCLFLKLQTTSIFYNNGRKILKLIDLVQVAFSLQVVLVPI